MFKTSVQKLQLSVGTKHIKQDRGYKLIFISLKLRLNTELNTRLVVNQWQLKVVFE